MSEKRDKLLEAAKQLLWVCQSTDIYSKVRTPFRELQKQINKEEAKQKKHITQFSESLDDGVEIVVKIKKEK